MNDTSTSLYGQWFDALPGFFRAMMPAGAMTPLTPLTAPAPPSSSASALPSPADRIGEALGATATMLAQFYQAWLPVLAKGGTSTETIAALANASNDAFQQMKGALDLPMASWPDAGWWNALPPGLSRGDAGETARLLQLGMDRTYSALGDAFGLRPVRDFERALREMMAAGVNKQRAQVEYLAMWTDAWNQGTQRMLVELTEMGKRGERVESLLALVRLWAKNVDGAVHEAMQSERGLGITAKVIREATTYREHLLKTVGLASEALHVPTRAEMDQAYLEIQELKRELRRLKKGEPVATKPKSAKAKRKKP